MATLTYRPLVRDQLGILFSVDDKAMHKSTLDLTHSHTMTPFDAPGNNPFEKIVGKGEIARNEQFLLFLQCFLPVLDDADIFVKFEIVVCKLL